jgi:hypothetical protein
VAEVIAKQDIVTSASEELAKHQKAYPPRYGYLRGVDRAQQLYRNLAPTLPPRIRDLFSSGLAAVGEVGRNYPDILRQVKDTLYKYYVASPQHETFIDQDTKKKMGVLLTEILPQLPLPSKAIFKK